MRSLCVKQPNTAKNKFLKNFLKKVCSLIALGALSITSSCLFSSSQGPLLVLESPDMFSPQSYCFAFPEHGLFLFQNAYSLRPFTQGVSCWENSQINLFKLNLKPNSTITSLFSPQYSSAEIHPNHKDKLKIKRWRKIFKMLIKGNSCNYIIGLATQFLQFLSKIKDPFSKNF